MRLSGCVFSPTRRFLVKCILWLTRIGMSFLRQYRNPIERVINSFPEHLNGNLLICYMQFVSSAHEYMDEFPQMYQQLLIREQDFLSNVAYGHKISLKDAKAFSRQALNTSIGKTFLGMFSEI